MKCNIRNLFTLSIILSFGILCAQKDKNGFSVYVSGPFSHLNYKGTNGMQQDGMGITAGIQYSRNIYPGWNMYPQWNLGIGLQYQSYNTKTRYNDISNAYPSTDSQGDDFEFRYTATNYSENQTAHYLNIPLNIQYETRGSLKFYTAVGIKAGIPIKANTQGKIGSLTTSGYYEQWGVELFDPAYMGYGDFGGQEFKEQSLDLNMQITGTFEAGVKQMFKNEKAIYIGLFIDYGFNNISKKQSENQSMVIYNAENPAAFSFNSKHVDVIKLMSYGIKIGYAFKKF